MLNIAHENNHNAVVQTWGDESSQERVLPEDGLHGCVCCVLVAKKFV